MNKKYLLLLAFLSVFILLLSAFTINKNSKHYSSKFYNDTLPPFAIKAKDHKGKSVVTANGVVSFTSGLHNDFYQVDSVNKTGYLYIETKLSAFMNDNVKRVPLNISIVIDRSGSMNGVKLGYAKKAAKGIIDQLKSEDFVSIVMYDNVVDSVQVPIHVIDKLAIHKKIESIATRGGTNLWGGTEKGYEYAQKNYKPGFVNRVLLISDGLANVGLTDPKLIKLKVQQYKDDNGITLSTFGVGLDYNETLMTAMAETGLGNYYFIDAPDKMAAMFNKELSGLLNVAAQNAELKITLPQGVKIVKAYPLKYTESGNEIAVKFKDLFSEETKGILFSFAITDGVNTVLKFNSTLSYIDVTDGQQKTISHDNILTPVKNVDAYLTHFNKGVIEQAILFTANENLETAMTLVDKGDYDGANNVLDDNKAFLSANAFYAAGNMELQNMDSINVSYRQQSARTRYMDADSVKVLQKSMRSDNYKLRTKKQ